MKKEMVWNNPIQKRQNGIAKQPNRETPWRKTVWVIVTKKETEWNNPTKKR